MNNFNTLTTSVNCWSKSGISPTALSDPEARAQCLLGLLHSLPAVNFKTAVFLFKHLRRFVRWMSILWLLVTWIQWAY